MVVAAARPVVRRGTTGWLHEEHLITDEPSVELPEGPHNIAGGVDEVHFRRVYRLSPGAGQATVRHVAVGAVTVRR